MIPQPQVCSLGNSGPDLTRLRLAPIFLGANLSWLLCTVMLFQAGAYSRRPQKDRPLFQIFVYLAVLSQVGETFLETVLGYQLLVSGWGNPFLSEYSSNYQPLFNSLSGAMVQTYFAWRIWKFCRTVSGPKLRLLAGLICLIIILLSIVALGSAIALPILFGIQIERVTINLEQTIFLDVIIWTVAGAIADIIIAVCMIAILRHARSKISFSGKRSKVSKIGLRTIQSGSFTAFLAAAVVLIYARYNTSGLYSFPSYILGKSYVISLLANLNAREDQSTRPTDTHTSKITTILYSPNPARDLELGGENNRCNSGLSYNSRVPILQTWNHGNHLRDSTYRPPSSLCRSNVPSSHMSNLSSFADF